MKLIIILICSLFFALTDQMQAQLPGRSDDQKQVLLPNGWALSPIGQSLKLGDLPLNLQISHNEKLAAVTNNGQSTQSIQLIDVKTQKVCDEKEIGKAWYGLAFSEKDDKLFVSGGNDNMILVYPIENQKLMPPDTIALGKPWPVKISPTGLVLDEQRNLIYVVTREDKSLYVIDFKSKKIVNKVQLNSEAYTCVLSPDKRTLYISLWGGNKIAIYDTLKGIIYKQIETQYAPNDLILNKRGSTLFVANSGDNSVSVIDTKKNKVIEIISASVYPTSLTGSTTNALALSKNEKNLYIANADNNCLAVFDVTKSGQSISRGFIPTGWYPTCVKSVGGKIWVTNGKGFTSLPNPAGPQPYSKEANSDKRMGPTYGSRLQYIGRLFTGTMSIIDEPDDFTIKKYSALVYKNTPINKIREAPELGNPIPFRLGDISPIKYIFYIIKENRTYDQVLGDMKKGNGDSSLCLFPQKITPNIHALADQFVLLDNFYVDAEVSADGHDWSMGAYANDYLEKTWPTQYGNRGGDDAYGGSRDITHHKDGYIWDFCKRARITYRTYGEFMSGNRPKIPVLADHFCIDYDKGDYVRDTSKFYRWMRDFDNLLAKDQVPRFNTIQFNKDHTRGQKIGEYTPNACLADNDLAVGLFVEHLSHSKIWKESLICVLEDDAQNGPDHVDAHRSPALIISPYVRRNKVVSTMYSTSGVLRTMELVLGLPPMSQYDESANPLYDCFMPVPDFTPFNHIESTIDMDARNVAVNKSSKLSETFNLVDIDKAPDLELNEVIWKFVKGEDSAMPPPRRSAFVILENKGRKDKNDD